MSVQEDRDLDDRGVSMIEVLVSMVVMSIVMTIFTSAIVTIYRVVNKTESVSTTQVQILTAFQRMDRELRYASAVSLPSVPGAGGDYYVEYLMTNTGDDVCVQLRLQTSTKRLERRSWPKSPPTATPSPWAVLVAPVKPLTSITPPQLSPPPPFEFIPAGGPSNYQSLRVNLQVTAGAGATATTRETKVTFTALNTTIETQSTSVCGEGRP